MEKQLRAADFEEVGILAEEKRSQSSSPAKIAECSPFEEAETPAARCGRIWSASVKIAV
jgi:hypothetical protein